MTASASTGVPSVNWMPSRSVTVHWLKSALASIDLARYGWTLRSAPTAAIGSKNERARSWQYESHCIAAGVQALATSASPLTTSLPPVVTSSTLGRLPAVSVLGTVVSEPSVVSVTPV